jgi:hypothetical protein
MDWCVSISEPLLFVFKTATLITFAFTQTGSTEWVEENQEMLYSRAVAYLNVDVSVVGPGFLPSTTPQLDELLQQVTKVVWTILPETSDNSIPRNRENMIL